MIAEVQAEPWEAVTTPPSPAGRAMYSCRPEDLIGNYSQCMRWSNQSGFVMDGYLFWGAEYWLLRERQGHPRYLRPLAGRLARSWGTGTAGPGPAPGPARGQLAARARRAQLSGFAPGSRTPPPPRS